MDFPTIAFVVLVICIAVCIYRAMVWCHGLYVRIMRFLGLRSRRRNFSRREREEAYRRQGGRCAACGGKFDFNAMEGDHIVPFSKGGQTVPSNLQMLCRTCNRVKGNR